MKLQSDLMKIIIFMVIVSILTKSMEYYVITAHITMASIFSALIIQMIGVYVAYRMILK